MKEKKEVLRFVGITILGMALNILGRLLAYKLNFPIWLGAVGTCVTACLAGPISSVIAALSPVILFGFYEKSLIAYAAVGVANALVLSYCARKQYLNEYSTAAVSSFGIGSISVLVSVPLNLFFYDGYAGNMWGDALFDMLDWYGVPKVLCAIAGEGIVEILDKQICVLLALVLIRLMRRMEAGKRKGKQEAVKALSLLLAGGILAVAGFPAMRVNAQETLENSEYNYVGTIYNNSTGIMSPEANVIEETDDGCIWIGSYAGLTRYDGREFEFIREGGITNVTYMLKDSKGRLWIGTNDNGIARYEDGEFTFFKLTDGIQGNSIRSFIEAEDGSIYVGTTDRLCKFTPEDEFIVLDLDIQYVISMEIYQGALLCVDNNGNLHEVKEDQLISTHYSEESGIFCHFVKNTAQGVLVGTSDNYLYRLNLKEDQINLMRKPGHVLPDVVGIEEGRDGRIWVCAETGFGFVDSNGKFYEQHCEGFDYSFEWIHEDYQGNIWLTSSRYGVLKMSQSEFVNLFARADMTNIVVNAVVQFQGNYYCGTDGGLVILDGKDFSQLTDPLTELLKGERIRCLMVDSAENLWICGYGTKGLLRYDASGQVESYTIETKGTTSDRFRCAAELEDGVIAVGTADGINFIKGDSVTGTLTTRDGLRNSQILSLTRDEAGILYAGTDGGGIYAIKDQKIIADYTTEQGLTSDVVLRIVPYDGGHIIVTSNSLCYKKGETITALENFPYFNNYDVMIKEDQAYVFSSAGIYIVDAGELCSGKTVNYELLNYKEGLSEGLTANSWNWMNEKGNMFICSNSGVIELIENRRVTEDEYKFDMMSVNCDGEIIEGANGIYKIPKTAKQITLRSSIKNYALKDVKVRFYIAGMESEPKAVSYQDLEPIRLSNLSHGNYTVKLQIMDFTGERVMQEKTYRLDKEVQVWEHSWFKAYLVAVGIELIVSATWTVLAIVNIYKRKRELEALRLELEEKVSVQMQEIRSQQQKMEDMFLNTVEALSEVVDAKDRYTSGHSRRVAMYSKMIAERMGKSSEECRQIHYAGLLHDVGKIRIPEEIINKPGKLTEEEYEIIKIHSVTGYHILNGISEDLQLALGAKFHHERYDGMGYPNGLQGENIPEVARIIGVADAYDAMTSNRSYRKTLPQEVVREEIVKGRGVQFDPAIADIMLQMMDEDQAYGLRQSSVMEKTILIVDDEIQDVETIQQILEDESMYTLLSAENEEQALECLKKTKVDLLLLDMELQTSDSFEILQKVREKTAAPVVFMTVDKDQETIQRVIEMGAEDYLTKPFLPMVLKEIVHSVLYSLTENKG